MAGKQSIGSSQSSFFEQEEKRNKTTVKIEKSRISIINSLCW